MRLLIDFWVYLATLTGYIPSHTIRLFLYRYLFRMHIGKDSSIHWRAEFNQPSGIEIGHNTIIGNDAFLDGRYVRDWKGKKKTLLSYSRDFISPITRPLRIGNNVSIGSNATILPVTITDYVVIGAGSVVTKDIKKPSSLHLAVLWYF